MCIRDRYCLVAEKPRLAMQFMVALMSCSRRRSFAKVRLRGTISGSVCAIYLSTVRAYPDYAFLHRTPHYTPSFLITPNRLDPKYYNHIHFLQPDASLTGNQTFP